MIIQRIQIKGAKEIEARLKLLPVKVQKSILRPALRQGAKLIAAAAKAEAPERSGKLKKAIKVKSARGKRGSVTMKVDLGAGLFQGETFYGAFQELGWHAGPRNRSRSHVARHISVSLKRAARSRRNDGRDYGPIDSIDSLAAAPLAKRGTRVRGLQDRYYAAEGQRQANEGSDRRFIEGKHFMKKAAERQGRAAGELSAKLIRDGIIKAATGGVSL